MADPKNPEPGDKVLDASDLDLKDLTPEQMRDLAKVRDGVEGVVALFVKIAAEDPALLERAGISPKEVQRAAEALERRKKALKLEIAAKKLAELGAETAVYEGSIVADVITEAINQAERRAKKDPKGEEILAAFEVGFDYQKEPARKGQATREKNKGK